MQVFLLCSFCLLTRFIRQDNFIKKYFVIILAVLLAGCGKNPLLSALPEAASNSGSGTTSGGGNNL